jgi:hypothetical protein
VVLDETDGLPMACAARCDFLCLMFKRKLSELVGTLAQGKLEALSRALAVALELGDPGVTTSRPAGRAPA